MMPLEDVMEHLGAALAALVIIAAVVVGTLVFMRLRAQAFEEYRRARERKAEARRALEPRPARCPRCGLSMGRVFNGAGWRLSCEACGFWGDTSDAEGRPE